jgi:hypothetical protein
MNNVTIECPHCGRTLEVPEDADKIVCMFCAQPIDFQQERTQKEQEEPAGSCAEYLDEAEKLLDDGIFTYRIQMNDLNGKTYPALFEDYEKMIRPALKAFRNAALTEEDIAVERMASLLFERFSVQSKEEKTRFNAFDCRFTITSLTIPSILEQKVPAAERLVDCFLQKWKADFPKQPLGKADYETIVGGFRKRLCFITTAVCTALDKQEPCVELDELRRFRDGWFSQTEQGPGKICEYYLYAPIIVSAMEQSGQGRDEYERIWEKHLLPCLSDLHAGDNGGCARRYEDMMLELEQKWLVS